MSTYWCKFSNCQCIDLPKYNSKPCNPYVEVKFNGKKYVLPKKKKTINPIWSDYDFKVNKFILKSGVSLRDKFISLVVHHAGGFMKDEIIGETRIDLHTVATGPIVHRLKLVNTEKGKAGENFGSILFHFRFKEFKTIQVAFSNVKLNGLTIKSKNPKYCLQFCSVSNDKKKIETDWKKSNNAIWDKTKAISYENFTFKDIKSEMIYVFLNSKKVLGKEKLATGVIEFKKVLKAHCSEPLLIEKVELKDAKTNENIGEIEMYASFMGLPKYCQMINGEHTNYGCHGDPLFDDAELPDPPKEETFEQPKEIQTFITIDLGTTHSGYSYCTHATDEISKVNIHMNWGEGFFRYKNKSSILYKDYEAIAWGFKAITQYNIKRKKLRMNDEVDNIYTLISDFKLNIHNQEPIVKNGRTFEILKVVSDFLGLIKEDIIIELNKQNFCVDTNSVKWILTVPAIWTDEDKFIMKEAAVNSGLIEVGVNDDNDHFSFALEPESASLPCLLYEQATIRPKTKFLVLDAGGGTIDISIFETVKPPDGTKFGIRQLRSASGGAAGGKFINDRFLLFIRQLISEKEYQEIVNSFDFSDLMSKWEEAKLQFNKNQIDDDIFISLPNALNNVIKNIPGLNEYYEEDEGDLVIPGELFFEIYRAPVEKTVDYVREEMDKLKKSKYKLQYIFMVGGFSESPILYDAIVKNFGKKVKIIKVPQPGIRVLQGATWFGKYPKIISSRCSSLTYIAMIPECLKRGTEVYFSKLGKKCKEKYFIMAKAGEIIETGKKFKIEIEMNGDHGIIHIFSTDKKAIKFIGPPECKKLLSINLKFKKKIKNIKLNIFVVFGETDLRFEVFNPKSGKRLAASEFKVQFDKKGGIKTNKKEEKTRNKLLTFNNRAKFKSKRNKRKKKKKIIPSKKEQAVSPPRSKPDRPDAKNRPSSNRGIKPLSRQNPSSPTRSKPASPTRSKPVSPSRSKPSRPNAKNRPSKPTTNGRPGRPNTNNRPQRPTNK